MRVRTALATLALVATPLAAVPVTAGAAISEGDLPERAAATQRLSGGDRVGTAVAVAEEAYPDGADTVLLARKDAFPDALAASYLAGQLSAPLLLTSTDTLSPATDQALDDLGATTVVIVGGTSAVSDGVAATLAADRTVRRERGANRYATAAAIARAGTTIGTAPDSQDEEVRTALLATGRNFPDALAGGPLAALGDFPLLLTEPDGVPDETRAALTALDIEQVIVLGGTAAVGIVPVAQLRGMDIEVRRLSGPDRFATAAAVADFTVDLLGLDGASVLVATGRNFPDALSLAPLADARGASLVLSEQDRLTGPSYDHVDSLCGAVDRVTGAGGTSALGDDVLEQGALAAACADIVVPFDGELVVASSGDPDAAGILRLYGDQADAGSLCYELDVSDLGVPIGAELRGGVFDAPEGPVAASLATPDGRGFVAGCLTDPEVDSQGGVASLSEALAGSPNAFHAVVRTDEHPQAAVRANLVHDEIRVLDGYFELDATGGTTAADYDQGDGAGSGLFQYTVLADRLCYQLDTSGMSSPVVAAHVHRGAVDANGPVELGLDTGLARRSLTSGGCVATSDQLRTAILDDGAGFYANVHTTGVPSGAIRGQLGATATSFASGFAARDAQGDFGAGDTEAGALVELYVGTPGTDETVVCVEVNGFGDPGASAILTGGAIAAGHVDESGADLVDLGLTGASHGFAVNCVDAPNGAVAAILDDPSGHHVHLDTAEFPTNPAYRGQVGADLGTVLTGAQEVAPSGADPATVDDVLGEGTAGFFVAAAADTICWSLVVDSLTGDGATLPQPSGLHVHEGAEGATGPVVLNLLAPGGSGFGDFAADIGLGFGCVTDAVEVPAVVANPSGHYLNLHTDVNGTAFVNGAVRGQLLAPA